MAFQTLNFQCLMHDQKKQLNFFMPKHADQSYNFEYHYEIELKEALKQALQGGWSLPFL